MELLPFRFQSRFLTNIIFVLSLLSKAHLCRYLHKSTNEYASVSTGAKPRLFLRGLFSLEFQKSEFTILAFGICCIWVQV